MIALHLGVKGGKSGLHRAGCWITSSGGDPKESATENRPPGLRGERRAARRKFPGKGETVR